LTLAVGYVDEISVLESRAVLLQPGVTPHIRPELLKPSRSKGGPEAPTPSSHDFDRARRLIPD